MRNLPISLIAALLVFAWVPICTGDDVPGLGDGEWEVTIRSKSPATEVAVEKTEEKEEGEETGDESTAAQEPTLRFRASVLGFGKDVFKIRPAVAPERELEFKTSQLIAINRIPDPDEKVPAPVPEKPKEAAADKPDEEKTEEVAGPVSYVVELNDGGDFTGQLASVDSEFTVLESEVFGPMRIPTQAVRSIARDDGVFAERTLPEVVGEIVASLETGEILKGNLEVDPSDAEFLTMTSAVASARFPLSAIGRIDFPVGASGNDEAEKVRTDFEIGLADGGRLVCSQVALAGDAFGMEMRSGVKLNIPVSRVDSIFPVVSGGGNLGSGVLIWGGYSDADEEYAHTRDSVVGGGIRIDEITEKIPGSDFRRRLFRSRAFLIPEMESLNAGVLNSEVDVGGRKMKLRDYFGTVMKPDLEKFMASGGHVVCTGIQGAHFEFLKLIGIEGVANATDRDGSEFKIPAEIQRKLRLSQDTLKPANATHCYNTPDGWEVFAGQVGKKAAAAISKRVRRGRITIFGADFYERNPSIDEFLQKTLRLTR